MSLLDRAIAFASEVWGPEDSEDEMMALKVKHEVIGGVDVFYWGPRDMFELNGIDKHQYLMAGNSPFLHDPQTDQFLFTGTCHKTGFYVSQYLKWGHPHAQASSRVKVTAWNQGAQKVNATKSIKQKSSLGLSESKKIIDNVLSGDVAIIECLSVEKAEGLTHDLNQLGFVAHQEGTQQVDAAGSPSAAPDR